MKKTSLVIGLAVGYVLGTRAGRERYEQLKSGASRVAGDPRIRDAMGRAQDAVGQQASAAAEAAKGAVGDRVSSAH